MIFNRNDKKCIFKDEFCRYQLSKKDSYKFECWYSNLNFLILNNFQFPQILAVNHFDCYIDFEKINFTHLLESDNYLDILINFFIQKYKEPEPYAFLPNITKIDFYENLSRTFFVCKVLEDKYIDFWNYELKNEMLELTKSISYLKLYPSHNDFGFHNVGIFMQQLIIFDFDTACYDNIYFDMAAMFTSEKIELNYLEIEKIIKKIINNCDDKRKLQEYREVFLFYNLFRYANFLEYCNESSCDDFFIIRRRIIENVIYYSKIVSKREIFIFFEKIYRKCEIVYA